jgi:low affinity Fe/Cu permease
MFSRVALWASDQAGRGVTFAAALVAVLVWAATGPFFHWSDTWQLIINTATTVITFLMVFLIQSTQNRDTAAIQMKLDELVRAIPDARNEVAGIEKRGLR